MSVPSSSSSDTVPLLKIIQHYSTGTLDNSLDSRLLNLFLPNKHLLFLLCDERRDSIMIMKGNEVFFRVL